MEMPRNKAKTCRHGNVNTLRPGLYFVNIFQKNFGMDGTLAVHQCLFLAMMRVIFFSPFSRSRSLVDDCFTGQSPGSAISIPAAPDVHEGLGQIQASAP